MPLFNFNQNGQAIIPLPMPIENGGTGSETKNFVDLNTNQEISGEKNFTGVLKSNSGILISGSHPGELGMGYGFIRHSSGPLLFFIGNESPFIFKNNSGPLGNLIAINQEGSISYMQAVPTGTGTTCVFSGGRIIALSSSIEDKENVRELEIRDDILDLLNPVTFNYKGEDQTSHGFIVEEVAEVAPTLAVYENGQPYSIQHSELVAVLWREVQKLRQEVRSLSSQFNSTN